MMKKSVAYLIIPGLLVLMGTVLVALSSPDKHDGAAPPLAPGVKILSIPCTAFVPASNAVSFGNTHFLYHYSGGFRYFRAPVILPHGTRIIRIGFSGRDNGSNDITLELRRSNDFGNTYTHNTISSTGQVSGFRKFISAVAGHVLNTSNNYYYLKLNIYSGPSYQLRRAFVYYKDANW